MKATTYKFGGHWFKAYCKPVGAGWEVGVMTDKKVCVFVGNFIHRAEATTWWMMMNSQIRHFTKTYWVSETGATGWYFKFLATHLYRCYYGFLDKLFTKYNKSYKTAFTKNVRQYNSFRKHWKGSHRAMLKSA